MGLYDKPENFKPLHWFWIFGLGLLYAVYTVTSWSVGYIDFGDGNYMYIARRIAEGGMVYRDILAPQPPAHLFVGAALIRIGESLGMLGEWIGQPALASNEAKLYVFRAFSMLLHLATYALVMRLAWRAWGRPVTTVVAGAVWLWLPINTWWSLGYQSEPLEIFFLLLMMTAALRVTLLGDLWAGVFAALAGLTNATAAPFLLVLIVYMIFRAPLRALRMAAPCVLLAGGVVFALERWTDGAFLRNAVFNQVGTFPGETLEDFQAYALKKLSEQGTGVLLLEGGFVFLALVGLWRYLATSPLDAVSCGGLGWFFVATLCSLVYVTKGGTMDYIFNLSEPAVAILAAGELVAWGRRWRMPLPVVRPGWSGGTVPFWGIKLAACALLAACLLAPGFGFHVRMRTQERFELPAERVYMVPIDPENPGLGKREHRIEPVARIVHMIQEHSSENDRILAPPYYAFLAGRRLWGDYSELFIWQMKYWNERRGKVPHGDGLVKTGAMADAIRRQELPLVMVEMDQTGALPEVLAALQDAYLPIHSPVIVPGEPAGYITPTFNTRLGSFEPLGEATSARLAEQRARWREFKRDLLSYYGAAAMRYKFPQLFDASLLAPGMPEVAEPVKKVEIKPVAKPRRRAKQSTQTLHLDRATTVTTATAKRPEIPTTATVVMPNQATTPTTPTTPGLSVSRLTTPTLAGPTTTRTGSAPTTMTTKRKARRTTTTQPRITPTPMATPPLPVPSPMVTPLSTATSTTETTATLQPNPTPVPRPALPGMPRSKSRRRSKSDGTVRPEDFRL